MSAVNLTLTSVVFEFVLKMVPKWFQKNLTLTSVVFELNYTVIIYRNFSFNFNKCCI